MSQPKHLPQGLSELTVAPNSDLTVDTSVSPAAAKGDTLRASETAVPPPALDRQVRGADETLPPTAPAAQLSVSSIDATISPSSVSSAGDGATVDFTPGSIGLNLTIDSIPSLSSGSKPGASGAARPKVEGYTILSELGRGGMGVVYKARHNKLHRVVALKMVLAGAHAGQDQLARFYTEAEAVAHLQQPHIVQIYEVGEHEGLPYFSLEYVDGGSLSERIGGQPQPISEAAAMVEVLARAMAYAHEQGIVHRDLKPANVLLTKEGEPKITDFGLAKRLESDTSQTRSGTLMGTPNYMAPEQARGEVHQIGPLADVYALGVILYEMMTGRTPFLGTSVLDTIQQVRNHEPVPPSRLQPKVPRDLETICLKCLEKDPAKRYVGAAELAEDLHRFTAGEPILARPVGGPERLWRWCQRNRKVAVLSAAVLLLLCSLAIGGPVAAVLINEQRSVALANEKAAVIARFEAVKNANEARLNEQQAVAARKEADQNAKAAAEQRGLAVDSLGTLVTSVKNLRATPATQKLKQDLLQTGIDGLRRVAKSAAGSHITDAMMAEAFERMGDVFQSVGEHAEARKQYEQAHPIRLALAGSDNREAAQRSLAKSFSNLGDIGYLLGDRSLATAHYREALRIREALAARPDAGPGAEVDLATSFMALGRVCEPDESRAFYMRALTIRQKLVTTASDAARPNRERDVWITFNKLAEQCLQLKDYAAAREFYDQALVLADKLSHVDHTTPRGKIDLGLAHVNAGNVRLLAGEWPAAKECFGKAVTLFRPLAQEDPRNLELQTNFALVLARRGDHVEAVQRAETLRSLAPMNFLNLYNIACCYALCSVSLAREKPSGELTSEEQMLVQDYADKAITALQHAVARGLKGGENVTADSDLDAIRNHPAYAKLLEDLK